ncbi:hypothetical protein BD309DRAFT_955564 [Dichomitus squalens]|uniref:Uncharacterized protein n=1 Tax=Dichomitus squalens TaxID=114155 RepID=A0A4Q9Q853_9APHY|nr:hypothetical protein BD309DRAFT_955564 [Dichomitus squalens]TBU62784.1 hypothetical protein BD310DRAFT_918167 [Dichomitus squalens]
MDKHSRRYLLIMTAPFVQHTTSLFSLDRGWLLVYNKDNCGIWDLSSSAYLALQFQHGGGALLPLCSAFSQKITHVAAIGHEDASGTIRICYWDDRHVVVSDKVSTVVQFRNLDDAMERGALYIELPQQSKSFNSEVNITDPSVVDVWLLNATIELSHDVGGSMDYASARRELLTTLTVSHAASSHSDEFHSVSGAFTTLELVCST